MSCPRIAIPTPTSQNEDYNQRCWHQYAECVTAAGGEPVRIPLTANPAQMAQLIASCQGVILPGSPADVNPARYGEPMQGSAPDDPARDAADELLLQDAFHMRKPLLGVCYGFQNLNVWLGGSLTQDLPTAQPESPINHSPREPVTVAHTAALAEGSLLAALAETKTAEVNSSHHQAVARPGDGLRVTAICPEDGVIEAAEWQGGTFTLGLQWHPKRTYTQSLFSRKIFAALIEAAGNWQEIPNGSSAPNAAETTQA